MATVADKQTVQVTILHQTYILRASGDGREVEELAESVDRLMTAISARTNADSLGVAVLACLHLADQLRGLERELATLRDRVENKTHKYRLLLDQALEDHHS